MAHNTYIRGTGILADWPFGSTIQPAEFLAFDIAQFKSINGDDGGTWSPINPIIIGGGGLDLTSILVLEGTGDTNPHINTIIDPTAWKEVVRSGATGVKARQYLQNTGGRGWLWTVNARWDGATWDRDTGGSDALALELNGAEVAVRTASAGDPFASFNDAIVFNPTNPAISGGVKNTLYPAGICAAWGYISTNGAGTFTVSDGYGLSAIVNDSGDALITLTNAMATANYAVTATPQGIINAQTAAYQIMSTTQFRVRIRQESAGALNQVDQNSVATTYAVHVFGKAA